MIQTLWTSYALIFLGLWQIASSCTWEYAQQALVWSDAITGLLFILCGFWSRRHVWAYWSAAGIGVWLQMAPLLFWAQEPLTYLNDTLIGALAILFSLLLPAPFHPPLSSKGAPPGFSYNPSSWPQRMPIFLLACIGWFVSRYLAAGQLHYIGAIADPLFGQGTMEVITSAISQKFPVSDAGLGAVAYTLEALLTCKGGEQRWRTMPWMVLFFGLLVIPLGLTSITLIILQPLVVGAWCSYCLFTALCMVIMIPFAIDEVVATLRFLRAEQRKGKWREVLWRGGEVEGASVDQRTPSMEAPFSQLLPAMAWGVYFSWDLLVSAALGVAVMLSPYLLGIEGWLADVDHVVGALIVVVSIVSSAEVIRGWRRGNCILGLALVVSGCFSSPTLLALHIGGGGILMYLSAYKKKDPLKRGPFSK